MAASALSRLDEYLFDKAGTSISLLYRDLVEYLQSQTSSPNFVLHVITPTVRLVSGRALEDLTGLEMILVMRNPNNLAVPGGNIPLVDRLFRLSGATSRLSDAVQSITRGEKRKYKIVTKHMEPDHEAQEYDVVVITASFHSSGVDLSGLSIQSHRNLPPYVQNHITHAVIPERIAPSFFNLRSALPNDILTAPSFDSSGLGILGIEHLGYPLHFNEYLPQGHICDEYHEGHWYKILSTQELSDNTIFDLMGKDSTTFDENHIKPH
ncbi:hypothetical protein GQ44DRAFT_772218 [Phaeosphaeriaceae sp. PMI808]|nr:hypothetical protein GQ44DRAFT_772218 [Phaeosphaeriaceae sp. PMI808]